MKLLGAISIQGHTGAADICSIEWDDLDKNMDGLFYNLTIKEILYMS